MPRTPRKRIAEGIFRVGNSLTAVVQVGTWPNKITEEKPFDLSDSVKDIQRWRERRRNELLDERPTVSKGTIAAELTRYLERCKKYPASLGSRESEMKAWIAVKIRRAKARTIGGLRRHMVKPEHCDAAIAAWLEDEKSEKTILNRCRTFHHFYVTMANDKKARTPLDNVDIPRVVKKLPIEVPLKQILEVEAKLREGDPQIHARYMVFAAVGVRPSQLVRLQRTDVNLELGLVKYDGGKGGKPIVHALSDDMIAAWTLFDRHDCYGEYDREEFLAAVHDAGWPAGLPVYNTKHTFGMHLADLDVDNKDIQDWFGHTDLKTTAIYTGVRLKRMKRVAEKMNGRLGWKDLAGPAETPSSAPSLDGDKAPTQTKTGGKSKTSTVAKTRRKSA